MVEAQGTSGKFYFDEPYEDRDRLRTIVQQQSHICKRLDRIDQYLEKLVEMFGDPNVKE